MIVVSTSARKLIESNGIKEIYLELRYTKGPCEDNLCKMIPHVDVSLSKHSNSYLIVYEEPDLTIFAVPPIADSITKHRNDVNISKSGLTNSLRVSGIVYSF